MSCGRVFQKKNRNNQKKTFFTNKLDFSFFSFSSHHLIQTQKQRTTEISQDMSTKGTRETATPVSEGDLTTKKEFMEGSETEKNDVKAVSLLEERAALGDADAMYTLAKYYALGNGIERSAKRAEELISECAKKGSSEAHALMELIKEWKGENNITLSSLRINIKQKVFDTLI